MHLRWKFTYLFHFTLITILVSGCAANALTAESRDTTDADKSLDAMPAMDIVSVLRQIDSLAPEQTTLDTSSQNSEQGRFADALESALHAAGYAVRIVGNGSNTIPISFELQDDQSDNQLRSRTVTVYAGDIAVRRTYSIDQAGKIMPRGAMQVRGADARNLVLDDRLFSMPANAPVKKKAPEKAAILPGEQLVLEDASPVSAIGVAQATGDDSFPVGIPSSNAGLNPKTSVNSDTADSSLLDLVAPSVPAPNQGAIGLASLPPADTTENFMNLRQSNFADTFAEMGIIREKVLIFPNDSTFMGNENKARLNAMLEGFNAQSDVLSVIGCSLGATNHAGGQEALARGRAMRVRDELLYAGIPEANILEEGCWAEEAFDQRMPRRGVVVTLKRRIG